ncbi:MAG: polymerase, sigma-24 subunit, subfamily [Myxococcaceae bacterium]|nr:polymerase, sigma-24 subunit, subfamily [Myxococcaceae bacterium]
MTSELSEIERAIAVELRAEALEQVALLTLRAYGDELLGYLIASLRSEQQASEVFSMFAEDLWQALPKLALRSTMRAYCYALARHAARRYLDRDVRKQRRYVPLSAALSRAVQATRTATGAHLLSENKRRIAVLRARLSDEERELLTLRIDRGLSWHEVAEALGAEAAASDAIARYRKRFQLTKQKLARWAREEGIVPSDESES